MFGNLKNLLRGKSSLLEHKTITAPETWIDYENRLKSKLRLQERFTEQLGECVVTYKPHYEVSWYDGKPLLCYVDVHIDLQGKHTIFMLDSYPDGSYNDAIILCICKEIKDQ